MVSYKELGVGDPLAYVFQKLNLNWISGVVAIGAIIAMASVLLVFQVGQPRIWMSMSRDGLLPPRFGKVHKRFHTPAFSTIITGIIVATPALFLNLTEVTDLTSIGTLMAFILVCGGILLLKEEPEEQKKGFRVPYFNSRHILPPLILVVGILVFVLNRDGVMNFFSTLDPNHPDNSSWQVFRHKIPFLGFLLITVIIGYRAIAKNLSAIPVLGLLTNLYLISELGIINWMRFLIWLAIGLVLYFLYGKKHSLLEKR